MSSNAIPGFFGSLFGELLLDRDCASIEQDSHADPVEKEICQQFRAFNEALGHGFHIEHRPLEDDTGKSAEERDPDPHSLRDSILQRPRERKDNDEDIPLGWPSLQRRQPKADQDLDSSVRQNPQLLDNYLDREGRSELARPHSPSPRSHSFSSSSSVVITTRPDGTYEERRTVRDSDGNEEVTVTFSDGKTTRTEVHKSSKDGTTDSSKTKEEERRKSEHTLSDWLWSIR